MTNLKPELLNLLQHRREELVEKLAGLSEYEQRRPRTPTGTNLLGLIKHLAGIEYGYLGEALARPPTARPSWFRDDPYEEIDMWATPDETSEYIVSVYREAWAHSDETVATRDLDSPAYVAHWADGHRETTLGVLLVRVLAETAQHAGHADLLRALADDRT
ncbi:DinB family protein [Kribbella solani]|uniref:DinB family protein n=1 Tax=Kribbella solani TaxID=236067 RepID=UPI0029B21DAD|nr:DinB family protein [Kribbella solani]MDX2974542.1 DinB family protein [Kribbella solani]MDX3004164.1 DinB family protein [Kribbella solani]